MSYGYASEENCSLQAGSEGSMYARSVWERLRRHGPRLLVAII